MRAVAFYTGYCTLPILLSRTVCHWYRKQWEVLSQWEMTSEDKIASVAWNTSNIRDWKKNSSVPDFLAQLLLWKQYCHADERSEFHSFFYWSASPSSKLNFTDDPTSKRKRQRDTRTKHNIDRIFLHKLKNSHRQMKTRILLIYYFFVGKSIQRVERRLCSLVPMRGKKGKNNVGIP